MTIVFRDYVSDGELRFLGDWFGNVPAEGEVVVSRPNGSSALRVQRREWIVSETSVDYVVLYVHPAPGYPQELDLS